MKTNDFIKKVEDLGFKTVNQQKLIRVDNKDGAWLIHVRKDTRLDLAVSWVLGVDEELFDLAVEYAKTPIYEREEPKKYYLKHKYLNGSGFKFLNFNKDESSYLLSIKECNEKYQTEFTQEEIENLPFPVTASEWDLIEVVE